MQLWIYGFKKHRYIQGRPWIYTIAVTIAVRNHLFSFRTQKLSSLAPTILCWRRHGKIGSCCIQKRKEHIAFAMCLFFCSNYRIFPTGRGRYLHIELYESNASGSNFRFILLYQRDDIASLSLRWMVVAASKKKALAKRLVLFFLQRLPAFSLLKESFC